MTNLLITKSGILYVNLRPENEIFQQNCVFHNVSKEISDQGVIKSNFKPSQHVQHSKSSKNMTLSCSKTLLKKELYENRHPVYIDRDTVPIYT